jgi:hypothetical protein
MMNTTPILTAAALLAAGLPAFSQDDPFGGPPERVRRNPQPLEAAPADPFGTPEHQPREIRRHVPHPADPFAIPAPSPQDQALLQIIPNLDLQGTSLDEVVDYLQEIAEKPLNFVVKEPANDVQIRSMRLRNVSMQTVLDTIEALAPVHIATIPGKGDGAPVIVIEATAPPGPPDHASDFTAELAERFLIEGLGPKHPRVIAALDKRKASCLTRAYPVRPMLETVKLESLIELINEFWDRSEPGWPDSWGEKAISLHEETGMLIVRAPTERHKELEDLIRGLNTTVDAARREQRAVEEVRQQLHQQLEHKDRQIEQLKRTVSELERALDQPEDPE